MLPQTAKENVFVVVVQWKKKKVGHNSLFQTVATTIFVKGHSTDEAGKF